MTRLTSRLFEGPRWLMLLLDMIWGLLPALGVRMGKNSASLGPLWLGWPVRLVQVFRKPCVIRRPRYCRWGTFLGSWIDMEMTSTCSTGIRVSSSFVFILSYKMLNWSRGWRLVIYPDTRALTIYDSLSVWVIAQNIGHSRIVSLHLWKCIKRSIETQNRGSSMIP